MQTGELEEFYVKDNEPDDCKMEKHYYMVITLAGYGVIAADLMRSGTKNVGDPSQVKYWYDTLVDRGIGTANEEKALRAMKFNVRTSLTDFCFAHALM